MCKQGISHNMGELLGEHSLQFVLHHTLLKHIWGNFGDSKSMMNSLCTNNHKCDNNIIVIKKHVVQVLFIILVIVPLYQIWVNSLHMKLATYTQCSAITSLYISSKVASLKLLSKALGTAIYCGTCGHFLCNG